MNIGAQLVAPQGLGGLRKGCTYHLFANTCDPARALLVRLEEQVQKNGKSSRTVRTATLIALPQQTFEHAIDNGLLVPDQKQSLLPPWLSDFENRDIGAWMLAHPRDERRIRTLTNKVLVAAKRLDEIVKSRYPVREINRYATQQGVNTARYRLALCLYVLFGRRPQVLMSLKFRSGRYDRSLLPLGTGKLGRPSAADGKRFGFNLRQEEQDRIVAFYRRHRAPGVSRTTLYRKCMREEFGCQGASGSKWKILNHPQGAPFPTKRQFDYLIKKVIGHKQLDVDRYGIERSRNRLSGSRGKYNEQIGNLLECLESDGYTTDAHPIGFNGDLLPKLTVVRIIDRVSRQRVGIGFSLGGERASAYRMALFSMAMDKVNFCKLFGLNIRPEEWPGKGWPTRHILDRGSGASLDIESIPFTELAVAYSGQAKAIAESSHPRATKLTGAPTYLQTNSSVISLVREELVRLVQENCSVEVARTPRMIQAGVPPYPNGIWSYLEDYHRKDGFAVSEYEAISTLPRVDVQCTKNGIQLHGETFRSAQLYESGLLDRAAREGVITLRAHMVPMCVRAFWIEHKGQMLEVQWALPFDDNSEQVFLTLDELAALQKQNQRDRVALRQHQHAVEVDMRDRYEATYGEPMGRVVRRPGRAKVRGKSAQEEARATKKFAEGQW